ncbi:MAG TPA: gamma-glutamyl-phosphate reductase, partial [Kiritimatiellia bacterium]|nr:gamma-glutamyl-phosphate reductase [Kiritimatiellia bacterium]
MNIHDSIRKLGDQALSASRRMVRLSSRRKNAILLAMADAVDGQRAPIQAANAQDIAAARATGLSGAMIDRLTLTDARI